MVIARTVKGYHQKIKIRFSTVLLGIFFILPFFTYRGHPLVQFDIPNRHFYIFGLTFWPQDLFVLNIFLIALGLILFLVTALYGRIFCAWACPQSVLTDLFDFAGRLVGGSSYGKRSASLFTWTRVRTVWVLLALLLAYFFIAYFKGIDAMSSELASFSQADSVPTWVFFWGGFSLFTYIIWGHARENVCNYLCPYGRFQTAMLDNYSPIITYDVDRGEPRRQKGQKPGEYKGDCTSCNMCVLVCPTGIDIREGLQVGCIRCGLCADACTIEMAKKEKKTLIDLGNMAGATLQRGLASYVRPRTMLYAVLLFVVVGGFITLLATRSPLYMNTDRDRTMYEQNLPGLGVRNAYEVQLGNKSFDPRTVSLSLTEADLHKGRLTILGGNQQLDLAPEEFRKVRVILQYAAEDGKFPPYAVPIKLMISDGTDTEISESVFTFPH